MNKNNTYIEKCPLLYSLNRIGGKWRLPIIWHLKEGSLRYNELKRNVHGITNIMLTRSLKDLEEYGLVNRVPYSEVPPHVEYSLTEDAKKLLPILQLIKEWGDEQILKA